MRISCDFGTCDDLPREKMTAVDARKKEGGTKRLGRLGALTIFLAWLPPHGFLFGTHWIVIGALMAKRGERMPCVVHFVTMIMAVVLLAVGGVWCRTTGRYTNCTSGVTMTRSCMWEDQENIDYKFAYVGHFVAGCILLSSWILDGLSLPGWLWSATRVEVRRSLKCAYSSEPLWPLHMGLVAIAWLVMCVTWMGIAPWSTEPRAGSGEMGLVALAAILIAECVLVFAIACFAAAIGRRLGPEARRSSQPAVMVVAEGDAIQMHGL